MNFTLRQWAVIAGLSAAFIVTAIVVSQNEPAPSTAVEEETFDEVLWCETANAISRWGSILDGSLAGDSLDDLINLETTLDEARGIAPAELRTAVARLFDYALLTVQAIERNDGDLDAGLVDAKGNTDQNRVNEAIERVNDAVVACGHDPIIDVSA
ncbi:MAG: hypothetical protein AAGA90_16560 [Actinomycetota bacterium]